MFLSYLFSQVLSFEIYEGEKSDIPISYYSMIKLTHTESDLHLSSIELNYPSGSFQQMTRASPKLTLAENYWAVYPMDNETDINQGKPIECGATIQLMHVATNRWLHSHKIKTPFGNGYEVSCFDDKDSGNLWYLECNDILTAGSAFRLQHINTGYYLAVNNSYEYPNEQGGGKMVYLSEIDEGNEWYIPGSITVDEL